MCHELKTKVSSGYAKILVCKLTREKLIVQTGVHYGGLNLFKKTSLTTCSFWLLYQSLMLKSFIQNLPQVRLHELPASLASCIKAMTRLRFGKHENDITLLLLGCCNWLRDGLRCKHSYSDTIATNSASVVRTNTVWTMRKFCAYSTDNWMNLAVVP